MNRITDINVLEYFENDLVIGRKRVGVYQCKWKDENKFFILNDDTVYVLMK